MRFDLLDHQTQRFLRFTALLLSPNMQLAAILVEAKQKWRAHISQPEVKYPFFKNEAFCSFRHRFWSRLSA